MDILLENINILLSKLHVYINLHSYIYMVPKLKMKLNIIKRTRFDLGLI